MPQAKIFAANIFLLICAACASPPLSSIQPTTSSEDLSQWKPCFQFAGSGNLASLKDAWDTTCRDAKGPGNSSLLMIAAFQNQIPVMEFLLTKGAEINQTSSIGDTALNYAAVANRQESLLWLLHHRADPQSYRIDGITALMQVLNEGHEDTALSLINENFPVIDLDSQGWPPLFFAIRHRQLSVIKALIKHGANVEIVSKNQETAFSLCVEEGWKEGSEFFLHLPKK